MTMKRILIIIFVLTAIVVAIFAIWPTNPPKFVKGTFPKYVHRDIVQYFGAETQVANDKLWIWARSPSQDHFFLLDVKNRQVVGELANGWPVALNSDATKVLSVQRLPRTLQHKLHTVLQKVSFGMIKARPPTDVERMWVLNLTNNVAVKLGEVSQAPGATTFPLASPNYTHVVKRSGVLNSDALLCDFQREDAIRLTLTGVPIGWWTDNELLLAAGSDYVTHDIRNRRIVPLLASAQIDAFLQAEGIDETAHRVTRHFVRRGLLTDIYLTTASRQTNSYSRLIKLDRATGALRIVSRKFDQNWVGELDSSDRYYVFRIRRSGGVYLQDTQTDTVRALVPNDESSKNPRPIIHRDTVLYVRSNMLWQVDFRGSNNVLLFPPPN